MEVFSLMLSNFYILSEKKKKAGGKYLKEIQKILNKDKLSVPQNKQSGTHRSKYFTVLVSPGVIPSTDQNQLCLAD